MFEIKNMNGDEELFENLLDNISNSINEFRKSFGEESMVSIVSDIMLPFLETGEPRKLCHTSKTSGVTFGVCTYEITLDPKNK